jgi:hypothetical protein
MAAATPSPMSSSQTLKSIPAGFTTMNTANTLVVTAQMSAAHHQRLCPETPTICVIDITTCSLEPVRL